VEGGEDLIVRRGRRVRHVRLLERLLGVAAPILVVHVDHGPLAQSGERLMCRLRRVDPDARVWRREEALLEPYLVARWFTGLWVEEPRALRVIRGGVGRCLELHLEL